MPTVDIYTTPTCGFCKALKTFLSENNIPFTEHDILDDKVAFDEMQQLSGGSMSVPFIVFNKDQNDQETQLGFNLENVKTALNL